MDIPVSHLPKVDHTLEFADLERIENAEIKFFCEAFSFIDSMSNTSLLLSFMNSLKKSKNGKVCWGDIPDLFLPGIKMFTDKTYMAALQRIFLIIEQIVLKGWVTPSKIRSLSNLALKVHHTLQSDIPSPPSSKKNPDSSNFAATMAWKDLSNNLKLLAHFQDTNMKIHEDFQKENSIPSPNSWKVYTGTFLTIFLVIVYSMCFSNRL